MTVSLSSATYHGALPNVNEFQGRVEVTAEEFI